MIRDPPAHQVEDLTPEPITVDRGVLIDFGSHLEGRLRVHPACSAHNKPLEQARLLLPLSAKHT
eukprot:scaffold200092_cov28-Tisochrysis_lutea.AAC.2